MEFTATTLIGIISALVYVLAGRAVLFPMRDRIDPRMQRWLLLTLLMGMLTSLSFLFDPATVVSGGLTVGGLRVLGISLIIVLVSSLTLTYLRQRGERGWLLVSLLWWVALVAVTVVDEDSLLGREAWIEDTFSPLYIPGVMALAGWVVLALVSIFQTMFVFAAANLPEVANRAIFWVLTLPVVLMGAVLAATNAEVLVELGLVVQTIGLMSVVYAAGRVYVLDVRRNLVLTLNTILITLLGAATILVALIIANNATFESDNERFIFYVGLAAAAAVIYTVLRLVVSAGVSRVYGLSPEDVAAQLHDFAEAITGVVELDELLKVVLQKERDILRIQRGGLVLLSEDAKRDDGLNSFRLKPHAIGDLPNVEGSLLVTSPILRRLLIDRKPLTQYEIDYDPAFQAASAEEKDFFKQLRMAAYAPVLPQGETLGILCAGPKSNDEPFQPADLELLATVANQAGVALRNARLLADVRDAKERAEVVNTELQSAKEQLEQLDSVKTDFITIASHELRTPLAQIRGYTDIIEALNESGMLDPEQLASMTSNLRKATDRMEELIRNMLDVSQLDVNAMDLRFSKTTIENVVRLSIEPLTESIRNRKQSVTARGLRGLPEIEADMQRLVQAVQNVVLNAVKFTPDGGRIDINGSLRNNPKTGRDEILIAIKDTGIGIDKKNQEIVFEKFVRAHDPSLHSTGKTKFMGAGPGLGLTIARGVIEGHGGKIWVESEGYDQEKMPGSTFYIVLPVKPPEDATGVLHFEPTVSSVDRTKLMEEVKAMQQQQGS